MTDAELLAKKLALIESLVADLRRLARPAEIARDIREQRFVEHTLQIAMWRSNLASKPGSSMLPVDNPGRLPWPPE